MTKAVFLYIPLVACALVVGRETGPTTQAAPVAKDAAPTPEGIAPFPQGAPSTPLSPAPSPHGAPSISQDTAPAPQGAPFHPDLLSGDDKLPAIPPEPVVSGGLPRGVLGTASGTPRFGRRWSGHPRVLVILVDFSDLVSDPVTHNRDHYRRLLFSEGELESGSLREWYQEASYGRIELSGEIRGWYRMPDTYADYVFGHSGLCGECYPNNARAMAEDALMAAINDGLDVSEFDNDGPDGFPGSGDDDGILDGVIVVFPGFGAERTGESDDIRSHYWSLPGPVTVSGITIPDYLAIPERENVGVAVHEFGHLLGAEDLYDLSGRGNGVGYYSVMAYGMWLSNAQRPGGPDAYTRILWGLVDPENPGADEPILEIPAVMDTPYILRLWTKGEEDLEYFLVENRRSEGFDRFLPADGGLLVYHVDEQVRWQNNSSRYRVAVVQADGLRNLEWENGRNAADQGDYFPGRDDVRTWDDTTTPSSRSNTGEPTRVALRNIGDPGPVMTVSAEVGNFIASGPLPKLEVVPASGIRDGGLTPGTQGAVRIRILNQGTRLGGGRLSVFSRDPRVALVAPLSWATRDLAALDEVEYNPLAITVTGLPPDSRSSISVEAVWNTGNVSHHMAAALPLQGTRIRREDFEEPAPDVFSWTTSGTSNPWQLQQGFVFEGDWAWGTGFGSGYGANTGAVLQLGPVTLDRASELRFVHYVHTQAFDEYSYDGGFLEASSNDGKTWEILTPVGGYPTTFALTSGNNHPGVPAWGGPIGEWEEVVVPLSHLTGDVLFRFHFESDFTGSNGIYRGWFIDDLIFRSWGQTHVGVFDPPVIGETETEIGFSVLPLFEGANTGKVFLTRESGGESKVFGPWAYDGPFAHTFLATDQDPGRVYRYWLRWEDPDQPRVGPLVVALPGPPVTSLLSKTPGVLSRSRGGEIQYLVPGVEDTHVTLEMFDFRGGRVLRLVDDIQIPGPYRIQMPSRSETGRSLAAGMYFLQIRGEGFQATRKLILVP